MNIKFKTSEIIEKYNSIEEFIKKDIDMPTQCAWDIEDNQEAFKKVAERFEKHRQELLNPLHEKGAFQTTDDGRTQIKDKYIKEFNEAAKKIDEYLNTENEFEIKTISKEDLPEKISAKDIRAIRFMID